MSRPLLVTCLAFSSIGAAASAHADPSGVAVPALFSDRATLPFAATTPPARRSDAVELGRPDVSDALASLAGGADCCPPPPCCERPWKGKIWGSFSLTSGNTDTIAAVFGAEAIWTRDPWSFKAAAEFIYGSDQGDTTAERINAILRVDRKLNDGVTYVFGQLTFDRDEPAGLESRFIPTVGIGRVFFKNDRQEFKGEVGGGLTHEKRVGLDATTDPSGYLGLHYVRTWEAKRAFHADFEMFPNLNDFDLSVAKLAFLYEMPVSDTFRVTAGLRFDYVVNPPPGREDLDTLITVGFSANF